MCRRSPPPPPTATFTGLAQPRGILPPLAKPPGGGGSLTMWLATHPCPKKLRKGMFFQPYGVVDVFHKKGCFFILRRTLGVPGNKMLETLIQNAILGYLSQYHNNSYIRHLGLFLQVSRHLGFHLEVDERGWITNLSASDPPPPPREPNIPAVLYYMKSWSMIILVTDYLYLHVRLSPIKLQFPNGSGSQWLRYNFYASAEYNVVKTDITE